MLKLKKLQGSEKNIVKTIPTSVIRVKKDLDEYEDIPGITLKYNKENPMKIELEVIPEEGYYKNGRFQFKCIINEDFPYKPPEFHCENKIYHPNIDLEGHVCLNILRNDWKPTLSLQLVFAGILHLFLHPNPNDPLNKDAANDLSKYPDNFKQHVRTSMRGGYVGNESFDLVLPSKNYV